MRNSWPKFLLLGMLCVQSVGQAATGSTEDTQNEAGDVCLSNKSCFALYKRARELSRTGQLEAAAVFYREAYQQRPAAWLLLNLGRVLHRQGKLNDAVTSYQNYLRTAPPTEAARTTTAKEYLAQALQELGTQSPATLPPTLPPVTGPVSKPEDLLPEIEPAPAPLIYEPILTAADSNGSAAKAADSEALGSSAQPAKSKSPSVPLNQRLGTGFWAGIGASGGLLAASVVTGSLVQSGANELQTTQYLGAPPANLTALQERSRALAITTDVLMGCAAVTLVTVLAVTFGKKPTQPALSRTAQASLSLQKNSQH